ncbi:MAG: sulfate adenylyltransferase [Actinobacteria bacterium]|nr:sulfate adenylyltransferase [Actinomycetota bacterium]
MTARQTPLGGSLVDRVLVGEARAAALERCPGLPALMIDSEAEITCEMIATGVFSPLTGFLTKEENESVLQTGRLPDGTPWPIPLSLAPAGRRNAEVLRGLREGDEVALIDRRGECVALQRVNQVYTLDREARARSLFGTGEPAAHPGVESMYRRFGSLALAGPLELLRRPGWGAFEAYRMTPRETYEYLYDRQGYSRVAGFVTGANPPHMGHEHMHRVALELVDAVLLLPQVEMERPEYIEATHRILALETLRDVYYPPNRVVLAALRTNYLFAGPREAVLHALIMRNYGCTHALIGRDHAGVGDRYDMYAGQRIFTEYEPGELGIEPLFFSEIFLCTPRRATAPERTCPHDARYRLMISGTGIREVLRRGYLPPKEICRPEVGHVALRGVVPKGVDAAGRGVYPVGQTIHSLFPHYEVAVRLGGHLRPGVVPWQALTDRDLEAALLDSRTHADEVYAGVFAEFAAAVETDRRLAERWRVEAREILADQRHAETEKLPERAPEGEIEAGWVEPSPGRRAGEGSMRTIRAIDFTTADYPRVASDDPALEALALMAAGERDYAMVVEQGDIVGVVEQAALVFAYGRGELRPDTRVAEVARDLPWIDPEATFDDVVRFMAALGVFQVCIENRVLDDFMLLRAIWTAQLATAREFREYEPPVGSV